MNGRYLEDVILEVEEKKEAEAQSCLDRIWYSLNCSTRFDRVIMAAPREVGFSEGRRWRMGNLTQPQMNGTRNWEMELRESMSVEFAVVQVEVALRGPSLTTTNPSPSLRFLFFPKFHSIPWTVLNQNVMDLLIWVLICLWYSFHPLCPLRSALHQAHAHAHPHAHAHLHALLVEDIFRVCCHLF